MNFLTLFLLSALVSVVSGHARIKVPKPLNAPAEDPSGNAYNAPLSPTGSDFPCKGLHKKSGVDKTPTQKWAAGQMAMFEILGHVTSGEGALAAHSGGSCQASLSFDDGKTWKAMHSYEGGCPRNVPLKSNLAGPNQTFPFMIPKETKSGRCLFAWTWTAVTGNRDEFYMNCAAVEITGYGTSTLDEFPDMFVGDMDIPGQIAKGECRSTAGNNLLYPNLGPSSQVTKATTAGIPFKGPTEGKCFALGSKPKSSGTGTSAAAPSLSPTTAVAPSSTPAATDTTSTPVAKSSSYPAVGHSSYASGSTDVPVGTSTAVAVTSLSKSPTTDESVNSTPYQMPRPADESTSKPTAQDSGASYPCNKSKQGHGLGSLAMATSSYPVYYSPKTMLTYTSSAVTPAAETPAAVTPTPVKYAQKVSSSVYY